MTQPTPSPAAQESVTFKLDGKIVSAAKGQNLLEALLTANEEVSYFCYHPGLSIAAACRQCLVAVGTNPKLVPACQMTVQADMEVFSQRDDVLAARQKMLEFTLVNHPVDCVICDKAGECSLQRHYMDWDANESLVAHEKVEKPKKVDLGPHIVLDAERCILCSRCVRFCAEVPKSPQLVFSKRGDHEELTTAPGHQLDNAYSLNTVDICPVGALTDKDFRFKIRVWELFSTRSVCTGCATGCDVEIHHHKNHVYRMVPPKLWDMNLNWMCDYGRRTYKQISDQRVTEPLINGQRTSLSAAIQDGANRLKSSIGEHRKSIGVVICADVTNEDSFTAARFAYDFIETDKVYLGKLPNSHAGDSILRSSDPNPNATGVSACGRGQLRSLADLKSDLQSGAIKTLYVVGDALQLDDQMLKHAAALNLLVVQAAHESVWTKQAHVVLPAALWAEVTGTLTNEKGETKRLRTAVEPPGLARPHWQLLNLIGHEMGLKSVQLESAKEIFAQMTQHVHALSNATWGADMPTMQLRFAGRRG